MSGAESAQPSFEWFVSLGNLLTILISGSAVIGAVYTLIRYLRQNVTRGIDDMNTSLTKEICSMRTAIKQDMTYMTDKIHDQERLTRENLEHNARRLEEVKNLIAMVERRIEDTNKRIDIRMSEISRLSEKLDILKDEHHRLTVAIARKLDIQEEREEKREDRARVREEKVDRIIDADDHDDE